MMPKPETIEIPIMLGSERQLLLEIVRQNNVTLQILQTLLKNQVKIMADTSKLESDIATLKQGVADLGTTVDTRLAALQQQIASLLAGTVPQEKIDAIDQSVSDIRDAVTAETTKVAGS